ncbi:nuclear transport factor 2 family protein [Streptacidiphilus anmyonensis]|uniref:nuclear transport factor 2 family protein n=1 Tax=Streptacidiphilus anmyonensis TaxID=405782 RepID=UPI0006945580|nr:nuclear transport factor 2 family protein [Streptacidiphilus anmyonensis]
MTGVSHQHDEAALEVVRQAYAFLEGTRSGWEDLVTEDVVIRQSPEAPWGGRHEGPDGFRRFLALFGSAARSRLESRELFVAADLIVQVGVSRGEILCTGATFETREIHLWRVRDGRIAALDIHVESAPLLAALGSRD